MKWRDLIDRVYSAELSISDLGLLSFLYHESNRLGIYKGSAGTIAKRTGENARSIRRCLRRLKKAGAIEWDLNEQNKPTRKIRIKIKRKNFSKLPF